MEIPVERLQVALEHGAELEAWIEHYGRRFGKFRKCRDGGWWRLRPFRLGMLAVRSGRLVAGDPGFGFDMTAPFVRQVPPGEYAVWATVAVPQRGLGALLRRLIGVSKPHPRVAFLTLLLTAETPATYEFAAMQKDGTGDRPIDELPGFGVDSAEAALMDADQLPAVKRAKWFTEHWGLARRAAQGPAGLTGLAALVDLPTTPPVPAAVCDSGWGDGAYLSYWGLNARGAAVRLIVDFNLPRSE